MCNLWKGWILLLKGQQRSVLKMGTIPDHRLTKECNWHGSKGVLVFRRSDLTFRQSKCFDFGLEWRLLEPPAFFDVRWSEVLQQPASRRAFAFCGFAFGHGWVQPINELRWPGRSASGAVDAMAAKIRNPDRVFDVQ